MAESIDPKAAIYASSETNINARQVETVLELLLKEECTVPFITRYRKEKTGGLDEEQIRAIEESYNNYLEREKRRAYVLDQIKKMDMLTPELEKQILAADSINVLEDLYAPYKSKKKSKGQLAREAGLLPLAELILARKNTLDELKSRESEFLNKEMKIATWDDVVEGVQNIIVEIFAHDTELKEKLRKDYWQSATLKSTLRKDGDKIKDAQKFKDYFEFEQPIKTLRDPKAGHRVLAVRRGMTLKILKVDVEYPSEAAVATIKAAHFKDGGKNEDFLLACAEKSLKGYIHTSLDTEIKTELKQLADESAIGVFGANLKNLLLRPYLGPKTVLALDPGVRTGCKTVVVDKTGKFLFDTVIYPHEPKNDTEGSKLILERLIEHYNVEYIAIGNGTFGRETLAFVEKHVAPVKEDKVKATLVDESGASIYSASAEAKKEFPDKDATVRGAISIARRFQDPLAELVKIDPKSIGVGQYQHDVNQIKLKKSLTGVVESCVNYVGVDLNTASAPLLSYISGIGPTVAGNIVKYREDNNGFKNREQLLKVPRFSNKVFEQSAGFLRIYNGDNPLDSTFIHPERYGVLQKWASEHKTDLSHLKDKEVIGQLKNDGTLKDSIGAFTLDDIVKSLSAPSQDPRTEFKSTEFRKDIKSINDLQIDQFYTGVVTNITNFGAFVDIGIKENGLVHVSQMADKFIENPLEFLTVGQEVKARVTEVDKDRGRISLSLRNKDAPAPTAAAKRPAPDKSKSGGDHRKPHNKNRPKQNQAPKNNPFAAALKDFKVK